MLRNLQLLLYIMKVLIQQMMQNKGKSTWQICGFTAKKMKASTVLLIKLMTNGIMITMIGRKSFADEEQ